MTGELDVPRLMRAVVAEATCERWGDLHSIRWASETFAALVAERYAGTLPPEYDCPSPSRVRGLEVSAGPGVPPEGPGTVGLQAGAAKANSPTVGQGRL